jgi:hypothetical protein
MGDVGASRSLMVRNLSHHARFVQLLQLTRCYLGAMSVSTFIRFDSQENFPEQIRKARGIERGNYTCPR